MTKFVVYFSVKSSPRVEFEICCNDESQCLGLVFSAGVIAELFHQIIMVTRQALVADSDPSVWPCSNVWLNNQSIDSEHCKSQLCTLLII